MEEIEQHNKELRKENKELKDSCVSLQKQNSDLQAELQKKQVRLPVKGELGERRSELMVPPIQHRCLFFLWSHSFMLLSSTGFSILDTSFLLFTYWNDILDILD